MLSVKHTLMLALALVLGVVWIVQAASAGRPTCVVSGARSLQEAIDAATAGDTLVVKGTCSGTATIDKDLTLKGVSNKSFGTATLDGGASGRVLRIDGGVTAAISGLMITNGAATAGGGILNSGSVTLTNSTVTGNAANQSGGGIFNNPGAALTLINSTVSDNTATFAGGGIMNQGASVALTNSTVSGNTAGSASIAGFGGGIWNDTTGNVTLTDSTVSGNTASGNGGGIYNFGTVSFIGTNTFINNVPNDCAGFPGC